MRSIAVVVPCHNLGRTVVEALDSVDRQTRPATELIVVDDGSDDPFTRWALASAERTGTRVVRTPNRGVAAARNLGVRLTSAPYIVLLDADDALEPEYLERLAGVLDDRPELGFLTCGVRAFGDATYVWMPPPCTWVQSLARGGPHASTMFRRTLWDSVGGFDEELTGYEDLDFWLSALERDFRGDVLQEPLLRYRVRAGSRYRRAIRRGPYVRTMQRLHRKHQPPTPQHGRDLLVEQEAFIAEQRRHALHLQGLRAEHERTMANVGEQMRQVKTALAAAGKDALDFGDIRRTSPISPVWGLDRGRPLDRYYIENFLDRHQTDIRGRVLEVKDPVYSTRFGGQRVTHTDVLDIDDTNPRATIVADLTRVDGSIPAGRFDCFILTQTLHVTYDTRSVLENAYRALKPGGVLLCTVPCVSRVSYEDGGLNDGDFWRFTEAAIRSALVDIFPAAAVDVTSHGNVMVCAAFLLGIVLHELTQAQLDETDASFPLICCVRAVKPSTAQRRTVGETENGGFGGVLLYHRVGSRAPDIHGLSIDANEFRDQMRQLRDDYRAMPLEDLLAGAASTSLPRRAVAVTFDDGYLEHLTVISPILVEYGIPATFFVNTDQLDDEHECWWDVLERVMLSERPLPQALDLYHDGRWVRPVTTTAERASVFRSLIEMAYPLAEEPRSALVRRVCEWSGLDLAPRPTHRPMTQEEIVQLAARPGHHIGAHTVHHLSLPHQPAEVQTWEVVECQAQLERLLKCPVVSFAYPYGEYSKQTIEIVRRAGFTVAATVEGYLVGSGTRQLLVPRLELTASNSKIFMDDLAQHFAKAGPGRDRSIR